MRIIINAKRQTSAKSKRRGNREIPSKTPRMPSTAYVTGLTKMKGANHAGRLVIGNSAPERKNNGKIRKLMIN
jgi:hypothetical protein